MLKTNVILSEVTNLSEARYAAGMGVEHLGFTLNPGHNKYVSAETVKSISEWVSGVGIIGDVGDEPDLETQSYPIDYIQVSDSNHFRQSNKTILKMDLDEDNLNSMSNTLSSLSSRLAFFILSISPEVISSHSAEIGKLCEDFKIYISSQTDLLRLDLILNQIKPLGLVIYGKEEERPGNSSYDGIAEILEALEID